MVIPAILSELDVKLVQRHYGDAPACWVRAERIDSLPTDLGHSRVWMDFEVDGCHHERDRRKDTWKNRITALDGGTRLLDVSLTGGIKLAEAERVNIAMLAKAQEKKVGWVTLPQFPITGEALREKDNRVLADGAGEAKRQGGFRGRRVLPVMFTHKDQINSKTLRKARVQKILKALDASLADAVWVCKTSLVEREGTGTFDKERFPDLIDFHELLRTALPKRIVVIAGPYWGIGLVLWARGFVDHPMALMGRTSPYYFPGGIVGARKATPRIALPPLLRVVDGNAASHNWLSETLTRLAPDDKARVGFEQVASKWNKLVGTPSLAQTQIAEFYAEWVHGLSAAPATGRAIALYQSFSSAYVLGRQLSDIDGVSGPLKRPERIAQQYLMHCL